MLRSKNSLVFLTLNNGVLMLPRPMFAVRIHTLAVVFGACTLAPSLYRTLARTCTAVSRSSSLHRRDSVSKKARECFVSTYTTLCRFKVFYGFSSVWQGLISGPAGGGLGLVEDSQWGKRNLFECVTSFTESGSFLSLMLFFAPLLEHSRPIAPAIRFTWAAHCKALVRKVRRAGTKESVQ